MNLAPRILEFLDLQNPEVLVGTCPSCNRAQLKVDDSLKTWQSDRGIGLPFRKLRQFTYQIVFGRSGWAGVRAKVEIFCAGRALLIDVGSNS